MALLRGLEVTGPPRVRVRLVAARSLRAPRSWELRWTDDGSLSQARDGDATWLRFHGAFDARCDDGDVVVRVRTELPTVIRGIVDLVVPMLRVDEGALGLHAAAFAGRDGATVVLGPNGAGKSTLSALASGLGWPVLADDCVVLEVGGVPTVARGVPSVGLSPAVAAELGMVGRRRPGEDKLDVALDGERVAPLQAPVARVVVLGERHQGEGLQPEAVGGATALAELADQCHAGLADPDPAVLLECLGRLVDSVPVLRARVPEGIDPARRALEGSGW